MQNLKTQHEKQRRRPNHVTSAFLARSTLCKTIPMLRRCQGSAIAVATRSCCVRRRGKRHRHHLFPTAPPEFRTVAIRKAIPPPPGSCGSDSISRAFSSATVSSTGSARGFSSASTGFGDVGMLPLAPRALSSEYHRVGRLGEERLTDFLGRKLAGDGYVDSARRDGGPRPRGSVTGGRRWAEDTGIRGRSRASQEEKILRGERGVSCRNPTAGPHPRLNPQSETVNGDVPSRAAAHPLKSQSSAATLERTDVWRYSARLFFQFRKKRDWRGALDQLDVLDSEARVVAEVAGGSVRELDGRGRAVDWDSGVEQTHIVYNLAMDTLAQAGRWQEAFELLETMRNRGLDVDVVKYNGVLKACSVAKQWEVALRLLEEMRDPSNHHLACPDVISFNTALAACARSGRTSEALALFNEMWVVPSLQSSQTERETAGSSPQNVSLKTDELLLTRVEADLGRQAPAPTFETFSVALSACIPRLLASSHGRTDEDEGAGILSGAAAADMGFMILEAMRRGDGGAPSPNVRHFKDVIMASGRVGHWERAISLLFAVREVGLEPTTALFAATITACGQSGKWRNALVLLREGMRDQGLQPDKFCCNAAIRACANAGQVSEAVRVLRRDFARNWRETTKTQNLRPDALTYSPILEALARQGDKDGAMFLLREIKDSTGYAPNMHHCRAVAFAFLNAGDEDGAFRVLTEFHTVNRPKHEQAESDECLSRRPVNAQNDDDVSFSPPRRPSANGYVVESSNGDAAQEVGETGLPKRAGVSEGLPFLTDDPFPTRPLTSAVSGPQGQTQGLRSKRDVGRLASLASALAIDGDWARCLEILEDVKYGAIEAVESVREMRTHSLRNSAGTDRDWWRKVAEENLVEEQLKEMLVGLKACYEAAIEALGYCGRWIEALQLLMEASARLRNNALEDSLQLQLDPSCFAPALRASGGTIPFTQSRAAGRYSQGRGSGTGAARGRTTGQQEGLKNGMESAALRVERCVALLETMRREAGVKPDARCVNVVMDACARAGAWGEVIRLFDDMAHESQLVKSDDGSLERTDVPWIANGNVHGHQHAEQHENVPPLTDVPPRRENRSIRESAADFHNPMAPTLASYVYALQACRGAAEHLAETARLKHKHASESICMASKEVIDNVPVAEQRSIEQSEAERLALRSVTLVRSMTQAGVVIRPDVVEIAKETCAKAGAWSMAVDIHKLFHADDSSANSGGATPRGTQSGGR